MAMGNEAVIAAIDRMVNELKAMRREYQPSHGPARDRVDAAMRAARRPLLPIEVADASGLNPGTVRMVLAANPERYNKNTRSPRRIFYTLKD